MNGSGGGAYYSIVLVWLASAIFFSVFALRRFKDSDGCLVAIANFFLAFLGGGLGLLLLINRFPYFMISSLTGAVLLPAFLTVWIRKRSAEP
jgi:hypothetical protein